MTAIAKELAQKALALSESERLELVSALLKSLPSDPEALAEKEWKEAWKAEILKRSDEIDSGKVVGISGDKVMAELRAKYG